ncbi:MAG: hypothetical protein ACRDPM_18540 [Solirubrobacteraceae bacterium]
MVGLLACESIAVGILTLTRESATFTDSDGWSWEFDLTFMPSHYGCIWGRGCPDITRRGSARGCCVLGVEIYQGEGDAPGGEDLAVIPGGSSS